jgi:hypothetical protein
MKKKYVSDSERLKARRARQRITKKKKYYEKREHFLKIAKKYRARPEVKVRMAKYIREYWKKNKKKIEIKKKTYAEKNKEYLRKKKSEYGKKNKKKIRDKARIRVRTYLKTRPQFKLKLYLRNRVREVLKEQKTIKSQSTFELIGCSPKQLRNHIQKLFKRNMNWNNYGKWHVDHIVPCSKFDLTDVKQQRICFNYKNLQPLWARENIIKSNK